MELKEYIHPLTSIEDLRNCVDALKVQAGLKSRIMTLRGTLMF